MAVKQKKSKFKIILIFLLIISAFAFYGYMTKDSLDERYNIKSNDQFTFRPGKSYINRTGKAIEEDKPTLTDTYWEGGKFSF